RPGPAPPAVRAAGPPPARRPSPQLVRCCVSDALRASYEDVPYHGQPRYAMHPDCLATLATLLGMRPVPVDRCRVLEVGCATGGTLIPLPQALPESSFVGIARAPGQIEQARRVTEAVGLTNVDLRPASVLDVDESFGQFDYILCHGVYSWVSPEVQDAILRLCRERLAPQGVAYVSYNTYPGWHLRAPVRDLMRYHVRDVAGAQEQIRQARAILDFLARAVPEPEGVYGLLLRD